MESNVSNSNDDVKENESGVFALEAQTAWINEIILPPLVVFGILGNLLTIHILFRNSKVFASSGTLYLLTLAATDTLFILSSILTLFTINGLTEYWIYWILRHISSFISDASFTFSVWLVVWFTVERAFAVCFPLKVNSVFSPKCTKVIVLVTLVFCIVSLFPVNIKYVVVESLNENNETTYMSGLADFASNPVYIFYAEWFPIIFSNLIPPPIIVSLNLLIIFSYRRSLREQRAMISTNQLSGSCAKEENRVTVTLLFIVLIFCICKIPTLCFNVWLATVLLPNLRLGIQHPEQISFAYRLAPIFILLYFLNSVLNFVLYAAISDKYKQHFLGVICFWRPFVMNRSNRSETPATSEIRLSNPIPPTASTV
jgi:hypothetical protein